MPTSRPMLSGTDSYSSDIVALRVLLVEDSRVLAERLRESLDSLEQVEVVGSVADETAAVTAVRENRVDVIILDLQLKEGTGFGVVQRLGKARPKIIVFTNYMLPEYRRLAHRPRLEEFLTRALDYERLPQRLAGTGASPPHSRLKGPEPLNPKRWARALRRGPGCKRRQRTVSSVRGGSVRLDAQLVLD